MLRELSIDGLINLLDPPNDDLRRMLAGLNIPMVWVNQKLDANCVYPDEIDGAFRLTRYLHAAGHRRIAYIDFIKTWERIHLDSDYDDQGADLSALRAICRPRANRDQPHYAYRDRREGYRRAMQQLGLEPHVSELQGACPFDQRAQVRQILAGPGRPTAVITPTSGRAVRIVRAAEAMGLRDPSDLTVASFSWGDSFPVELNLTLMVHDAAHLAQAAVQMITDRISNTGSTEPSRTVSGRLLIDQTIPRQAAGE
jgi:DNA-binding LacI/PurR family transcriptional regulator